MTSGSGQRVEATQEQPVTGNGHSGSEDSNLPGCDTGVGARRFEGSWCFQLQGLST